MATTRLIAMLGRELESVQKLRESLKASMMRLGDELQALTDGKPVDAERDAERIAAAEGRMKKLQQRQKIHLKKWEKLQEKGGLADGMRDDLLRWFMVMLATAAETYLQDAFSRAAGLDPKFMGDAKPKVDYAAVVAADSLPELANELRVRWARGWIDDGGPKRWLKRLHVMGVRGYEADLSDRLELMWGIRHIVVHSAGRITADFLRRHPVAGAKVGERIIVRTDDLVMYARATLEFVSPVERYLLKRFPDLIAQPPAH